MSELKRASTAAVSPQIYRSVAIGVLSVNLVLLVVAVVLMVLRPSIGAAALITGEVMASAGCIATLALLPRRSLTVAVAPLLVSMFVAIAIYGLLLTPLSAVAACGLSIIMILTALTGSRGLTGLAAALGGVTAVLLGLLAPLLNIGFDAGILTPVLLITGPAIVVGLLWFATDRLLVARDAAIALAERRAAEAEAASAKAEAARREAEQRADEQARLLALVQTLELPVLNVAPGVLAVPLIGSLDGRRLEAIRAAVLAAVGSGRAGSVVFDLTGLTEVDTAVAGGLISTGQAVRLLGARPVLSGVRASVARTLADLGVSLSGFQVVANLQEALVGSGD